MLKVVGAIDGIKVLRRQAGELSHLQHDVGPNRRI
jgi:hypothetical protein